MSYDAKSMSYDAKSMSYDANSMSYDANSMSCENHCFHGQESLMFEQKTCHPPVTLVTLKNRVQTQCLSTFCHPDTL